MRELFAWPVVLPGELVYFARTAALIEGVGSRYDRNFNSIRVASPVVMRLRRELIIALVGDDGAHDPLIRWAATLGAVAGGAAALFGRARAEWAGPVTDSLAARAGALWSAWTATDDQRNAPPEDRSPAGGVVMSLPPAP